MPLGEKSAVYNKDSLFEPGGSLALNLQYVPPNTPLLFFNGILGYSIFPSQAKNLSVISAGLGSGLNFRFGNVLSLNAGVELGWYVGMYPDADPGSNPYAGGSVDLSWDITPGLSLAAGAGYKYFLGYNTAEETYTDLYQGANITIGTVFHLSGGDNRTKVKVKDIEFDPVFPVFYGHYDDHSLGTVLVTNGENSTITDVKVYFDVNQYMEEPKLSAEFPVLKRGESASVDLKALFTNSVMQLTESTKVSAKIITEYTYLGERFTAMTPHTLRIYDRNSMMWDDDRKAASFVTAKDSTVLLFAKNTAGIIREQGNNPINLNFRIAMGIYETLRLYGMNYVIDPQSSYIEAIENEQFIDYLQFPSQSLTYRAGDCDDLSILFSALLEAVGIKTAFVTIPGHIFMAYSLDMPESQARNVFTNTEDFIFIDNETWVPMEITLITDGFLKSWKIGAKEWRENVVHGNALMYPIHQAWEFYEPVAIPGSALSLIFPSKDLILASYDENLQIFINREILPKVSYYEDKISGGSDSAKLRNRFGVLYARYGQYDDASVQFKKAIRMDSSYISPLINLGNIHFLNEDSDAALGWYEKAERLDPLNSKVIAAVARTQYELEEYEQAEVRYVKLKEQAPELAAEYAYLGNESSIAGRASSAKSRGTTLWAEDE
ncbi:MAG: hypothetical protein U9N32_02945 [Spirochaetota bacterium]|nr:hypothetical protein [Spirochaetota bacterium]